MGLKVDANISFMFKEWPNFIDRYKAAAEAGFKAVESGDEIFQYPVEEIKKAKSEANVQQVVIVGYGGLLRLLVSLRNYEEICGSPGCVAAVGYEAKPWLEKHFRGARDGLAATPGKETEFRQSFTKSLEYALALECRKIHICSGIMSVSGQETPPYSSYEETYINNLRYCSEEAKKVGINILIEPITTIPEYFLTNTTQAIEILKKLNCDNVEVEFDFFHAQRTHGNLTNTLKENLKYIGHIQVSQVPGRGEPSSAGEINYDYVFQLLHELGYNKWIGCEYNPQGRTQDGLKWVTNYGLEF